MIKELFATCLLSASVGTSGLNMQTRDVEGREFNYYMDDQRLWQLDQNLLDTYIYTTSRYTHTNSEIYPIKTKITRNIFAPYLKHTNDNKWYWNPIYGSDTNDFTVIEIEPQDIVTNVKLNIDISWAITIDTLQITNNVNLKILATTNENMMQNFRDFTFNYDYTDATLLNTAYTNFTNGSLGQNYTKLYDQYINADDLSRNLELNVGIPDNTKTYILILVHKNFLSNAPKPNLISPDVYSYNTEISFNGLVTIRPTTEIINIPGLMLTVLTMPFTFISMAFDLTLFPGTPYAINISNLFLAIIGVLILTFIMSKVVKR